jgi:hypothetical protein
MPLLTSTVTRICVLKIAVSRYDPTNPTLGIFGLNSAYILAPEKPLIFVSPYFGTDFHDSCQQVGACK